MGNNSVRKKALIVYTSRSTFVEGDIAILNREYDVTEYKFVNYPKKRLPGSLIREFFYLLYNLGKFDLVYIWFADYHSYFPVKMARLFGKKSYLVIGGYDVCREKRYGYGSFVKRLRGYMALNSIKHASMNLCVSSYIERVVRAIAPGSKSMVLYNGVDISLFEGLDIDLVKKEVDMRDKLVLCVAIVYSSQTYYIKGIDRYLDLSLAFPDNKFLLVGADRDIIIREYGYLPDNFVVMPKIRHQDLGRLYSDAYVYCQLSRKESFSLSLAEAMLYECVPVVTNTGGMSEVVGDLGVIVDGGDREDIIAGLKIAIERRSCPECRERIRREFSMEKRCDRIKIATSLFHSSSQ